MEEKTKALDVQIGAIEFGPDHVHLFVIGCKNLSASYLAGQLKGYSAYLIRKTCWEIVSRQLWGDSFWSDGYFFESVGRITSEMVQFYIERQQRKHWKGEDYEYFNVKKNQSQESAESGGQTSLIDFAK
jgi:REP element-mobilizing transposase RayT